MNEGDWRPDVGGPGGQPGGQRAGWGEPGGRGPARGQPDGWGAPGPAQTGPGDPGWGQSGGWGPEPPRRRGIGDLFEEAFSLYRRYFLLLVGSTALLQLPIILLSVPLMAYQNELTRRFYDPFTFGPASRTPLDPRPGGSPLPEDLALVMALLFLFILVAGVLGNLAFAAGAYIVGRGRRGDRPAAPEVLRALTRLAGAVVLTTLAQVGLYVAILVGLFGAVVVLLVLAVVLGGPGTGSLVLFVLGSVLFAVASVVVTIAVMVRLIVAVPALVHERLGPVAALKRSWGLLRGQMWRTFAIVLVIGLVVGILSSVITFFVMPTYFEGILRADVGAYLVATLLTGLVQVVLAPLVPAVITLLYFDLVDTSRSHVPA